jgi:hypothetical protein
MLHRLSRPTFLNPTPLLHFGSGLRLPTRLNNPSRPLMTYLHRCLTRLLCMRLR